MHAEDQLEPVTAGVADLAGRLQYHANPARPADLTTLSATESVQLLRAGVITSTELTEAELAKARANPDLNAFIVLDQAGALRQAAAADEALRAGKGGPLTGLPIVIKDNIRVAGLPARAGTPALAKQLVASDAPVLASLRAAGAVILGKTKLHELAFGISGDNEAMHGSTLGVGNAYDRTRMAGGSSSGNGAAIGARIVAAGIGTHTEGSARIPSAFNGIAGFRPTIGRYSAEGAISGRCLAATRHAVHPMAIANIRQHAGRTEGERSDRLRNNVRKVAAPE